MTAYPDDRGPVTPVPPVRDDAPVGELMSIALDRLRALARSELRLARAETQVKLSRAGIGLALLAGALLFVPAVCVMVLVTLMTMFAALDLPVWLSAFLATLLGIGIAAGLAYAGKTRLEADGLVPKRSLRQLARTRTALKERL